MPSITRVSSNIPGPCLSVPCHQGYSCAAHAAVRCVPVRGEATAYRPQAADWVIGQGRTRRTSSRTCNRRRSAQMTAAPESTAPSQPIARTCRVPAT